MRLPFTRGKRHFIITCTLRRSCKRSLCKHYMQDLKNLPSFLHPFLASKNQCNFTAMVCASTMYRARKRWEPGDNVLRKDLQKHEAECTPHNEETTGIWLPFTTPLSHACNVATGTSVFIRYQMVQFFRYYDNMEGIHEDIQQALVYLTRHVNVTYDSKPFYTIYFFRNLLVRFFSSFLQCTDESFVVINSTHT